MKKRLNRFASVVTALWRQYCGKRLLANSANPPNFLEFTGSKTYLADAGLANPTYRYSLVKQGSDQDHVTISSADTDEILGVCYDEPSAAEEEVEVRTLANQNKSIFVVCTGALAVGTHVCSNGDGTVKAAASGKYTIGVLLKASGATGDVVPMRPILSDVVKA